MISFESYSQIILEAFLINPRKHELIVKKQEILDNISVQKNSKPSSILFVGFGPWILSTGVGNISVTEINEQTKNYLDHKQVKYTYINPDDLGQHTKAFDWVVAADEYFTFVENEEQQREKIFTLASVAKQMIITTLKDYKNQEFKDREFSIPLSIRGEDQNKIFLEFNNHDFKDKNSWTSKVYSIENDTMVTHGPFPRCAMYFKQMAKFSIDAGASEFYVHKNLMYKSLIKKNYEHVISISFNKKHGNQ